ncbi:hypothetical protein NDU88_003663 [Pleurodeles waltl]|uniref:Uncharacterized protein n=1 Tax=Pleurodeles waltl TaxID=8319 RepID=A0AAV7PDH2_PLEWA|nr:hypothetical protein NDU88_003663 [Pleurodeles waltl]
MQAEEALRLDRLIWRHLGGPETSDTWPVTEPASAGARAELVLRADSLARRTEELGQVREDLRPAVLGRAAVRTHGGGARHGDLGREPQSISAPSGAKKRLRARRAHGLPADSSERWAEELGRAREDLRPLALGRAAVRVRPSGTCPQERAGEGSPKHCCPIGGTRKTVTV